MNYTKEGKTDVYTPWENMDHKQYESLLDELRILDFLPEEINDLISNIAGINPEDEETFLLACDNNDWRAVTSLFSVVSDPVKKQGYILAENGEYGVRSIIKRLYETDIGMKLPKDTLAQAIYRSISKEEYEGLSVDLEEKIDKNIMEIARKDTQDNRDMFFNNLISYLYLLTQNMSSRNDDDKRLIQTVIIPLIKSSVDTIKATAGRFSPNSLIITNFNRLDKKVKNL